ncbi:MAG TPA: SAM-dependent methyltransferase, partial [Rhodanobacter sp.]|nr:SAM-dependent methyltransferase [Rhodanobacter sp.]
MPSRLPEPSADERAHADRLLQLLREQIASHGPMPFSQYMERCLYAPGLGYYSAGRTKFGAAGDFVTAPEVSSLFSRCLARQAADVLADTGGDILELGAGSGRMAADVLTELAVLDRLPDSYRILEVSADLAERQR